MAYDIISTTLEYLVDVYTIEMQTNVNDALKVVRVTIAPLQDDPTRVAPFIAIGPDNDRGRIIDPLHEREIGGGMKWMNFFKIAGRIPQQSNRQDAYEKIGELNSRSLAVLRKYWDLNGLTSDDGESIFGSTANLIGMNKVRILGGDTEWFGEFLINLHWFSEETPFLG
jgi:hypothetical protein